MPDWMLLTYLGTVAGLGIVWIGTLWSLAYDYYNAKKNNFTVSTKRRRAVNAYRVLRLGPLIPFWPLVLGLAGPIALVYAISLGVRGFWRMTNELRQASRGELT